MKQHKKNVSTMSVHELVDWLNENHPVRCIALDESLAQAHRRAGRREIIDSLINRLEREENGNRPTTITV